MSAETWCWWQCNLKWTQLCNSRFLLPVYFSKYCTQSRRSRIKCIRENFSTSSTAENNHKDNEWQMMQTLEFIQQNVKKIDQINISKIKVWNHDISFLLNLLCNTEYMMLPGAMIRKKKAITILWTSPNYLFTWILMARSQFFPIFKMHSVPVL